MSFSFQGDMIQCDLCQVTICFAFSTVHFMGFFFFSMFFQCNIIIMWYSYVICNIKKVKINIYKKKYKSKVERLETLSVTV
jgi:hypothetical protein